MLEDFFDHRLCLVIFSKFSEDSGFEIGGSEVVGILAKRSIEIVESKGPVAFLTGQFPKGMVARRLPSGVPNGLGEGIEGFLVLAQESKS